MSPQASGLAQGPPVCEPPLLAQILLSCLPHSTLLLSTDHTTALHPGQTGPTCCSFDERKATQNQ